MTTAGQPTVIRIVIDTDARGVGRGVNEADSKLGKLSGRLGKLGGIAGVALGAVAAAAVGIGVACVKSASDAEQSLGAVETVFGKASKTIEGYAATSANRLGVSKAEYNTLAAAVGVSMTNIGKSQGDAAKTTDKIIARAADLAATFGGTTTEATQALGAAFRGEFDSVERLGISLKASDISAELAARGQAKLTGQALKNAQGQATLDLIMRQTTKAHGAFGRESDTVAHQQQVLAAKFENVKAAVGSRLTPILVKLAQYLQTQVIPTLQQKLGPVLARVGQAGQVVGGIYASYLLPIVRGLQGAFERVRSAVTGNASSFAKLMPVLKAIGAAVKFLAPIVGTVLGFAFENVGRQISLVINIIARIIDVVDAVIRKFDDLARKVGDVVGGITDKVGKVGDVLGKIPGFSMEVATATPNVIGGVGDLYGGIGMVGFSAGDPWGMLIAGVAAGAAGARPQVGGNTYSFTITGAIDPVGTARQIKALLRDSDARLGKTPAFVGMGSA